MKRSLFKFSLILMVIPGWIACTKDSPRSESRLEEERFANLSYGTHDRHRMDVYLPQGRSTSRTGTVILIHGGGFVAGDKTDLDAVATKLTAKGFAVVNINYRLVDITGILDTPPLHQASAVTIRQQLDDVVAAVSLAWSKRTEWTVSSDRWYIAGHSAGATLAMLYAYGESNADGRIKAAANWAGLTTFAFNDEAEVDLLDPRLRELFYRIVGAEATNANRLAYMAVSPYWVANTTGGVPTVNIRPEDNAIGFIPDHSEPQYEQLTELLNAKGSASVHIEISGADHGFGQAGNWDQVVAETALFFGAD